MHFLVQFWHNFGKKAHNVKFFKGKLFWKVHELSQAELSRVEPSQAFWAKIRAEPRLGVNTNFDTSSNSTKTTNSASSSTTAVTPNAATSYIDNAASSSAVEDTNDAAERNTASSKDFATIAIVYRGCAGASKMPFVTTKEVAFVTWNLIFLLGKWNEITVELGNSRMFSQPKIVSYLEISTIHKGLINKNYKLSRAAQ